MPDVKIRRLPEWVLEALEARARQAGRSLEEELRVLLTEAATRSRQGCLENLAAFREQLRRRYGSMSDSTPLIRQDRQERG
jgi:plasmid stability protein